MRALFLASAAILGVAAANAAAAQTSSAFRGVYIEGQAGGDRFQSEGRHNDKFGYGAAGGFDGVINEKFVVGPQFGYWRGRADNRTAINGGTLDHRGYNEWTAGVRAGYLLTPRVLLYGTGGYAYNSQSQFFSGVNGTTAGQAFSRYHTDGYYAGGGAEFSLTDMFYVGAGYRYSNYDNHTSRQRLFGTVGVRFK